MCNTHARRLETAGTTDETATNRQLRCDGGTPRTTASDRTVPGDTEASDPTLHPAETWHDCSGVQRDLLRVLHVLDAPTGLAIKRRLSTCYGTGICNAHLYQTLDQLVDAGLVTKGQQDGRTNAYDLTDRGRAALQARDELLQGGPDGRPAHSDDDPTDADLVTDGGEETVLPPSEQFKQVTDQHRERDGAGEIMMYGDIGFHTIFNPEQTEFGIGTNTAFHIALQETLQMVHLDTGLVRDHHGEVTPESVSTELDEEIDAVLGRRFREQFVQNFKEALENAEQQYGEFGDDVGRGDGIETDGGETQTVSKPDLHHISLDRSGGVSVVIHATSDRSAHDIEQVVKEDLSDQFHRVYRERDHNAHLNEEDAGFDDCYQVVVETTETAARAVARHVSERFSTEGADD